MSLTKESFTKENLPVKNLDIIDPLGSIRTCARELWEKDGCPGDADILEYWKRAEAQMLGGDIQT
jgi:hypothetical protein